MNKRSAAAVAISILSGALIALAMDFLGGSPTDGTPARVSIGEAILTGLVVSLAGVTIDLYLQLTEILRRYESITVRVETERRVSDPVDRIKTSYLKLAGDRSGETDLFVTFFDAKIAQLCGEIEGVVTKESLPVKDGHFLRADGVIDLMKRDPDKSWRFIWALNPGDGLFLGDPEWTHFVDRMLALAKSGVLEHIKCLLVISETSVQSDEAAWVQRLFANHERTTVKAIDTSYFNSLASQCGVSGSEAEFAIYGSRLYFVCPSHYDQLSGEFRRDRAGLEKHRQFFDRLWENTAVLLDLPTPPDPKTAVVKTVVDWERARKRAGGQ